MCHISLTGVYQLYIRVLVYMVEFGTQMRILNCECILCEFYDVQMVIAFMLWILQKTISVTIFSYVQKW